MSAVADYEVVVGTGAGPDEAVSGGSGRTRRSRSRGAGDVLRAVWRSRWTRFGGPLILLGLFTRIGLLGTFALLIVLLFGTSMQQSWVTLAFQLIYVLMVSILLLGAGLNSLSLDALLEHSKRAARVR